MSYDSWKTATPPEYEEAPTEAEEKLECPHCRTEVIITGSDIDLIDRALGCLTSDYNDVDHEAIAELRKRLRSAL